MVEATHWEEETQPDFVKHYATAWESGKVMVVCIDKLTCVRMHELIKKHWQMRIVALEAELADAPDEQEEIYRRRQLAWMRKRRWRWWLARNRARWKSSGSGSSISGLTGDC